MMTILLTPLKLIGQILLLPLILVLTVISVLAEIVLNLGAYVVGPFVFLILGGIIYTVYKQIWFHTGMLTAIEVGTLFLYSATGFIVITVKEVRDWMVGMLMG